MTILRRIMGVVKSSGGLNPNFENYYSRLMSNRIGETGLPTAREAQRDREAALATHNYYSMR